MSNPLESLVNSVFHKKPSATVPVGVLTSAVSGVPAGTPVTTVASKPNPFAVAFKDVESFMAKIGKVTLTVDNDLIKYTPAAVHIANVVLPEYTVLEDAAGATVVGACDLLKNGIILVQRAYANQPAGAATNAAKKAEVMTNFAPAALTILQGVGIKIDASRISNVIDAMVQILNSNVVPVAAS